VAQQIAAERELRFSARLWRGVPHVAGPDHGKQDNSQEDQLNAHPQLPALKALPLGKEVGSSDQQNIKAKNLGQSTRVPVGRGDFVVSFDEIPWESRPHSRVTRRPHRHPVEIDPD